jgi:CDP-glycerol glycerophosphotransferase
MINKLISYVYRIFFNGVARFFPVKEKTILFESFNGKLPSDNPLAIYQEFMKQKDSSWHLYWGVKKQYLAEAIEKYPDYHVIPRFSLKWLFITTRANFWVFNSRMPIWLKKNKGTIYIQTWHGTPLKKLGADIKKVAIPGTNTQKYHNNFAEESKRWDYLIAPNDYSKDIFKRAFMFENRFLEIGYPRNDILLKKKDDLSFKNQLKRKIIGKDSGKVFLYAPTWRDDYYISKGNYKFFMPFELEKVTALLDENDTLIIRPHYLVGDSIDVSKYKKNVCVCMNEDINDLYLISDALITDYSSVMFDYAHLKRPMLFYAYDFDYYKEELRGFYFDYYSELPGEIVKNEPDFYDAFSELVSAGQIEEKYQQKYDFFFHKFCKNSSSASQKVVELILNEQK